MSNDLIIFGAKYLVIAVVLMAGLTALKLSNNRRLRFVGSLIIAGAIAGLVVKLAARLYYNPRPFSVMHIKPLVEHANTNGFPSEHTTYAATIAAVIYFYRKQFAAVTFGLSIVIGVSRVLAHVHSAVDIIAGLAVGVIAGAAGYYLGSRLFDKQAKPFKKA